jgi:hypothetical protein
MKHWVAKLLLAAGLAYLPPPPPCPGSPEPPPDCDCPPGTHLAVVTWVTICTPYCITFPIYACIDNQD